MRDGERNFSGRTVIKETAEWVGIKNTLLPDFFLSTNPFRMSFSRIAALVAGVPSPFRSASSGISSFPAVSIACRRESSVKCAGGVVVPSFTDTDFTGYSPFSFNSGRILSFGSLSVYAFQPSASVSLPLTVKICPPQSSTATVSAYRKGSETAHKS